MVISPRQGIPTGRKLKSFKLKASGLLINFGIQNLFTGWVNFIIEICLGYKCFLYHMTFMQVNQDLDKQSLVFLQAFTFFAMFM